MKRAAALTLAIVMILATPALASSAQARQVLSVAREQLGAPYALKSDAPNSFNCLSFVAYCFNQVVPGAITGDGVKAEYEKISAVSKLKAGDIIIFRSARQLRGVKGCHFAIYAGKGYIIHAANPTDGVTVSKLKDYKKRFLGAVRIL
ncbi:MAG: C40 family peptidase [Clostridia bacterium]|nr:C40 family peptidase [Clostridia bacterium]